MEPNNQIVAIKMPPFKVGTKQDIAEILIRFVCVLKDIKLSKTEIYVLGYFMCEGYNEISKEHLLAGKIFLNKSGLACMLSRFRKQGILSKKGYVESIADDFNYPITDKLFFSIMLDNT